MRHCCTSLFALLLCVLPTLAGDDSAPGTDGQRGKPQRDLSVRELNALLTVPIYTPELPELMKLKEAVAWLQNNLARRGKELPIILNRDAFLADNPDDGEVWDADVKSPPQYPRFLHVQQVLRYWLRQVPTQNATFIVRPGCLEITTFSGSLTKDLVRQFVMADFRRQPLQQVLDQLYEQTGVPVVVDVRVADRTRSLVSARFPPDTTLGTALIVLADMVSLKMVIVNNVVYLTSPANAQQVLWEQYLRGQWLPRGYGPPYEIPGPGMALGLGI